MINAYMIASDVESVVTNQHFVDALIRMGNEPLFIAMVDSSGTLARLQLNTAIYVEAPVFAYIAQILKITISS